MYPVLSPILPTANARMPERMTDQKSRNMYELNVVDYISY